MKRSGTLTTPVTGLLIIVLLMGMEITKAQSFFRQTGIQLLTKGGFYQFHFLFLA